MMHFKVGDIVTRDGSDRHKIIAIHEGGDLIDVECIQEPRGWLQEDGVSLGPPWCKVGDRESNLPSRYSYPEDSGKAMSFEDFQKLVLKDIIRAVGLPYEDITCRLAGSEYSRVREKLIAAYKATLPKPTI